MKQINLKSKSDKIIARLSAKLLEKKAELTLAKKDRKRLNYAVNRLKKDNDRLRFIISNTNTVKVKELKQQIKDLDLKIVENENEANKEYKRYREKIEGRDYHYKKLQEKFDYVENIAYQKYGEKMDKFLTEIVSTRKWQKPNHENIKRFKEGNHFYKAEIERGVYDEIPIFSMNDLWIQIHPDTGQPLTEAHFMLLNKWKELNYDHLRVVSIYEKFSREHSHHSYEKCVENAYIAGMEMLPYYRYLLF